MKLEHPPPASTVVHDLRRWMAQLLLERHPPDVVRDIIAVELDGQDVLFTVRTPKHPEGEPVRVTLTWPPIGHA